MFEEGCIHGHAKILTEVRNFKKPQFPFVKLACRTAFTKLQILFLLSRPHLSFILRGEFITEGLGETTSLGVTIGIAGFEA